MTILWSLAQASDIFFTRFTGGEYSTEGIVCGRWRGEGRGAPCIGSSVTVQQSDNCPRHSAVGGVGGGVAVITMATMTLMMSII